MGNSKAAEDGMGSMDRGRHRYSKGDYAGALEAFTEVSTALSPFDPCSMMDSYLCDEPDHVFASE